MGSGPESAINSSHQPEEAWETIGNVGALAIGYDEAGGRVGVEVNQDQMRILIPRVVARARRSEEWTFDDLRSEVHLTLRILDRAINLPSWAERGTPLNATQKGLLSVVTAAFDIWEDYQSNGVSMIKQTVLREDDRGIPDWAATFRRTTPVLRDGEIAYTTVYGRLRQRSFNDFLPRLHFTVIAEVAAVLGLRSMEHIGVPPLSTDEYEAVRHGRSQAFRALRERTYSDRGRWLIDRFLAFWGISALRRDLSTGGPLSATDNFETLWQAIVDFALTPSHAFKVSAWPTGIWRREDSELNGAGILPHPDTSFLLESNNSRALWIIDAKDRPYVGDFKRLGSANDHYKQVLYALLQPTTDADAYVNVLVFPYLTYPHGNGCPPDVFGQHSWRQLPQSVVHEVALCFRCASTNFVNFNRQWRNKQFAQLETSIEDIP